MARMGKSGSGGGKRKVRVSFRANRAKPAREKDWTRLARDAGDDEIAPPDSERITAKGALSRKRTVIVQGDGADSAPSVPARRGTVLTVYGKVAMVDDGERVWPCTIRRVLRTRRIRDRNVVAVGDYVQFTVGMEREGVEVEGVIEAVEPRHGELKRVVGRKAHTLVANVDQVLIVASAKSPDLRPHLVDRYIVSSLHGGIEPIVCLNKADLAEPVENRAFISVYERIGYQAIAVSAITGEGVDSLRKVLQGKASVIAGQSGVGKSSLLNAVQPGLKLKVGDLVEITSKGRHTTSRATLLKLDIGGYVVDTPGVRSFDLSCVPRNLFEQYYVEFLDHVPQCKFPDCTHVHEDGCAVKRAVLSGEIHPDRFESYVRLFTDVAYR